MTSGLRIAAYALIFALVVALYSGGVSALGYGMYSAPFGYGWGGYPSYGYAGPYSYVYTPGSFWGHYYNPGLYYSSLEYSLKNNLLDYSQSTLDATYGFISRTGFR